MASTEHIQLSNFIKSVHQKLRRDAQIMGAKVAWKKHCEDKDRLREYAAAMQTLAVKCWEGNFKVGTSASSRINWVRSACAEYFGAGVIRCKRQKEVELGLKMGLLFDECEVISEEVRLKLLDVGSCYNPFKEFAEFDVVGVDLAPATDDVFKCDFLELSVCDKTEIVNNRVLSLSERLFHVVVFCLFLEYLPTTEQRCVACQKAYNLLKPEGLFFIITPDSKHMSANVKIMKTWRFLLAKIGFTLVKSEKLTHLRCLAFRKCLKAELSQRWAMLHENYNCYNSMVIPQDFNNCKVHQSENISGVVGGDPQMFAELPDFVSE